MDYKEFENRTVDYLSDNLSSEEIKEFEAFLVLNPEFQQEFEATKLFWNGDSEEVPEPTSKMDMNFYSLLKAEEEKADKVSILKKLQNFFSIKPVKQFAYTLAILTIGFFIGNGFNKEDNLSEEKIEVAQKETQDVRSQLVLTLLDQPSANKRLQAVSEVNKLNTVTKTIIKALFSTLNKDENVNVRLSALEALKKYTEIPLVREGLISSIANQTSPLVQMELADLMVVLQEKKAVKSFEKLIDKEDVNTSAKEKMKESIQNII
ncbi:HEAT repeat domain-containing protein [Polaribacter reichenbachii]|uniref:Uncharacterized protein n=1 Tax=Polaribacter reichenbachii TaxID=996801 RepID=A0A1B8U2K1_9FLAO|nr:HEAT repeat domain-containing protein [Polaribacter reichenbachii]OBY66009.1 hypothetical protein LPB301_07490 [Polaribacter reichenbachii]